MRVRIGLWMIAAATVAAAVVIVLMTEAPRPALSIEKYAASSPPASAGGRIDAPSEERN